MIVYKQCKVIDYLWLKLLLTIAKTDLAWTTKILNYFYELILKYLFSLTSNLSYKS